MTFIPGEIGDRPDFSYLFRGIGRIRVQVMRLRRIHAERWTGVG